MSVLLSVDPGIRGSGAAVFRDGVLVKAVYLVNPASKGNEAHAAALMAERIVGWRWDLDNETTEEIVIEWPRIYASRIRAGETKADPNDLLALAGVGSAVAALLPRPVICYAPSDWKGQAPKGAIQLRVERRLDDQERQVLRMCGCRPSKMHNVWDAVGIGLHHLGRFEKKRVIQ